MKNLIDLDTFPLNHPNSTKYIGLVEQCRSDLAADGMFNLAGFLRPEAVQRAVSEITPVLEVGAYTHRRQHNIYFRDDIPGLASDHPALRQIETVNHTVCADQIAGSSILQVYEFAPLVRFLAQVMGKQQLYLMADPLARLNVMSYQAGEALNWHFDRAEFTTTLLLQAPEAGGELEYRPDLRSDSEPNYDGVARLLNGEDREVHCRNLTAGTLNVFKGKNTLPRVTPIVGEKNRMIAVFSYYEQSDYVFSDAERIGFYGRAA